MAAGVRSIISLPASAAMASCSLCAPAEVASKTMPISGQSRHAGKPFHAVMRGGDAEPRRALAGRPSPDRCRQAPPSPAGLRCRMILIIRSVPILPDPMIATLTFGRMPFVDAIPLISLARARSPHGAQPGRRKATSSLGCPGVVIATATYCLPSIAQVIGDPVTRWGIRTLPTSVPFFLS